MSYVRLNLSDGQVFNASHVSHIEDGIEDCETQLSEVNQSLTDLDSGKTNYISLRQSGSADVFQLIKDSWASFDSGTSVFYASMTQVFGGIIFKYNEEYGSVICIGYSSSYGVPRFFRLNTGTWREYTFDLTEA